MNQYQGGFGKPGAKNESQTDDRRDLPSRAGASGPTGAASFLSDGIGFIAASFVTQRGSEGVAGGTAVQTTNGGSQRTRKET